MNRWNVILLAAAASVVAQSSAQQLILDGQAIDLDQTQQVIIEENGDIVVWSAAGDLTCSNVTTPPIVNLDASPSSLTSPGDVTLTWTTQFADTCTPMDGGATNWTSTPFNLPADASGETTITNLSASTNFTLSCDNALGTVTDSAMVSVSTNDEWGGFPPPSDWDPVNTPPAGTSHEHPLEVFRGSAPRVVVTNNFEGALRNGWPGIVGTQDEIYLSKNNWLALGFIAGQAASCTSSSCARTTGRVRWELSNLPDGPKVVSISRLPGDFSTGLGLCRTDRSPLTWTYNAGGPGCVLTLGETYYLNVIHGTGADPSVSTCSVNECGALIALTN